MPGPSLIEHFAALEDPRQSWKVLFPLPEVLLLVLCGTLAGAEDFVEIRRWGQMHAESLRRLLPFKAGMLEGRGQPYVLAVRSNHTPAHGDGLLQTDPAELADDLAAAPGRRMLPARDRKAFGCMTGRALRWGPSTARSSAGF